MKKYGLIGYPLGHSFSKRFFTDKFISENIDATYELFPIQSIQELTDLIDRNELSGLNVTIPYKQQVMPLLNQIDVTAAAVGAVNVIKFIRDDNEIKLKGYNTDVYGFEKSIRPYLQKHHTKALILGTGGASKAIEYVLNKLGIETCLVSRTSGNEIITYNDLNQSIIDNHTIIVNASPIGTYPNIDDCPQIPYEFITQNHLLFDAVYNPPETLFLKLGREQGAVGINGEQMLIGQALAAWDIWNK